MQLRRWLSKPGRDVSQQGMRKDDGPITDIFSGVMPFMAVYMLAADPDVHSRYCALAASRHEVTGAFY
jgi:hypothetical protein